MEKDFVPYKLSKKLKKMGFDDPCLYSYYEDGTVGSQATLLNYNTSDTLCSRPTFSQTFRWFRDKYELHQSIIKYSESKTFWVQIEMLGKKNEVLYATNLSTFTKYNDAEISCLKKLIEIINDNNK